MGKTKGVSYQFALEIKNDKDIFPHPRFSHMCEIINGRYLKAD